MFQEAFALRVRQNRSTTYVVRHACLCAQQGLLLPSPQRSLCTTAIACSVHIMQRAHCRPTDGNEGKIIGPKVALCHRDANQAHYLRGMSTFRTLYHHTSSDRAPKPSPGFVVAGIHDGAVHPLKQAGRAAPIHDHTHCGMLRA